MLAAFAVPAGSSDTARPRATRLLSTVEDFLKLAIWNPYSEYSDVVMGYATTSQRCVPFYYNSLENKLNRG
jgi:hypothetical protein